MKSSTSTIILVLIFVVALAGLSYYSWNNSQTEEIVQVRISNQNQVPAGEEVFKGDGFTFDFPETLVASQEDLWTEEGYDQHIYPFEECDTCQIPYIEIESGPNPGIIDTFIIEDLDLPGSILSETGIPYEEVTIGNNDFIKIRVSDLHDVTGYYTQSGNRVVAFKVYSDDRDDKELQDIIATLKFGDYDKKISEVADTTNLTNDEWKEILAWPTICDIHALDDFGDESRVIEYEINDTESLAILTCGKGAYQNEYRVFYLDKLTDEVRELDFDYFYEDENGNFQETSYDSFASVDSYDDFSTTGNNLSVYYKDIGAGGCGYTAKYAWNEDEKQYDLEQYNAYYDCDNPKEPDGWPSIL